MNTDEERLELIRGMLNEMFSTDPVAVTGDTRLIEDLGLDSIDAIDLAARVESASGQRVTEERLRTLRTVGDVVGLLRELSAISKGDGTGGDAAPATDATAETAS